MSERPTPPADLVRDLRRRMGSHDKLAQALGTSRQTIIRWEGGAIPSEHYARRLADLAGATPEEFRAGRPGAALVMDRLDSIHRTLALLLTARDEDAAAATERQARLIQLLERLSSGLSDLGRLVAPLDETAQQPGAVRGRRGGRRSA